MAGNFLVAFIVYLLVFISGVVLLEFLFHKMFNTKKTKIEKLSMYFYVFVVSCVFALATIYRYKLQFVSNLNYDHQNFMFFTLLVLSWMLGGILYKSVHFIMRKILNHRTGSRQSKS